MEKQNLLNTLILAILGIICSLCIVACTNTMEKPSDHKLSTYKSKIIEHLNSSQGLLQDEFHIECYDSTIFSDFHLESEMNIGDKLVNTIINIEYFSNDSIESKLVLLKTTVDSFNCPTCSSLFGLIKFERPIGSKKIWNLNYFEYIPNLTYHDQIPDYKIQKVGKSMNAIFLFPNRSVQGITQQSLLVYFLNTETLHKALNIENFYEDNSGICNEEYILCYEYESFYSIIESNKKYYDINLNRFGTKLNNEDLVVSFDENFLYEFDFAMKAYKINH